MFSNKDILTLTPSQEILELQQNFVNNLKPKQQGKIKEFRSRVQGLLKPTHNDFYLLKWLKARKFDVNAAEKMLKSNLKFRKEYRVDYILEEFEPTEVLLKYFPFTFVGEDKDGSPLLIVPSGKIDIRGVLYTTQKSDFVKYYIYILEYFEKLTIQQSEKYKKLITTCTLISDMENFKFLEHVWKPAMEMQGYLQMKVVDPNYPGMLKKALVINAPTMSHVFFWMIKPFMNEDTKSKMEIFGKNGWQKVVTDMVDPDQLPKQWGGNLVDEMDENPCGKVVMPGPVPKSYYKTLQINRDKMKSVTIPSKGMMKADIEITQPGSFISWTFLTEDYDIGFGISLKTENKERNSDCGTRVVVPLEKANSYLVPEDGKWKCEETGTYTVAFDNSYSWYRSKKLIYSIHVSKPDSAVTEIFLSNSD